MRFTGPNSPVVSVAPEVSEVKRCSVCVRGNEVSEVKRCSVCVRGGGERGEEVFDVCSVCRRFVFDHRGSGARGGGA